MVAHLHSSSRIRASEITGFFTCNHHSNFDAIRYATYTLKASKRITGKMIEHINSHHSNLRSIPSAILKWYSCRCSARVCRAAAFWGNGRDSAARYSLEILSQPGGDHATRSPSPAVAENAAPIIMHDANRTTLITGSLRRAASVLSRRFLK